MSPINTYTRGSRRPDVLTVAYQIVRPRYKRRVRLTTVSRVITNNAAQVTTRGKTAPKTKFVYRSLLLGRWIITDELERNGFRHVPKPIGIPWWTLARAQISDVVWRTYSVNTFNVPSAPYWLMFASSVNNNAVTGLR